MNKLVRLHPTDIEYLTHGWGVFSGCHNIQRGVCKVSACWAKKASKVHKQYFPNGFEPTFYPEALESPLHLKKPARISVGWMGDIIGYGQEYLPQIFEVIKQCPQHTFVFLTKNYLEYSKIGKFPDNCWCGVSTIGVDGNSWLEEVFRNVQAKVRFVSVEPFLDYTPMDLRWVDFVIVGAQTRPTIYPRITWLKSMVSDAARERKPIFLKNNLRKLITIEYEWAYNSWDTVSGLPNLRQELPNV
jgi:protein gp37